MELAVNRQAAFVQSITIRHEATPEPTPKRIALTCGSIILAALATLLPLASSPHLFVFDERVYVEGSRSILAHGEILNPEHPPLAKLLFAAGMAVAGDNPTGWRIASIICGAFTVGLVFLWSYLLLADYGLAIVTAVLTLFNNFLYVMSRTTMLDIPMFMFAMAALVGFTAALKTNVRLGTRRAFLAGSGVSLGLAAASKWTALDIVAALFAVTLLLLCARRSASSGIASELLSELGSEAETLGEIGLPTLITALTIFPVLTYALAFIPVFHSMHEPFSLTRVVRLQFEMWQWSKGVMGNRAIYAPWYKWPFTVTPMRGLSYLLGNPVVMWVGLAALVVCLWHLAHRITFLEVLVVLLYSASLLQWVVTPRAITYYYYYYPAAMFLSVAITVALKRLGWTHVYGVRIGLALCLAAALFFLYCYPRMAHLESPWECMFGCWV
jgi:dolichyl-phosphate-mannose-protein mannosyltransferase